MSYNGVLRTSERYGRPCSWGHGPITTFGLNIHRCGSCLRWWTTEVRNG